MTDIEVKRFNFLQKLYNECEQNELKFCNVYEIGNILKFDRETIDKIVQFFVHENFIVRRGPRGIIAITHLGICHVEKVINARMQLPYKLSKSLSERIVDHKTKDQIFKEQKFLEDAKAKIPTTSKENESIAIVELLKKDYLLKTEDGLKQEIAKVVQDFTGRGLANSTFCVGKQLQAHFDHNNKLIDHIVKSLEQDFACIPLANVKEKLFTILEEEYKKLIPFANSQLVNAGLAQVNILKSVEHQINREKGKAKQIIEIKCAILEKQKTAPKVKRELAETGQGNKSTKVEEGMLEPKQPVFLQNLLWILKYGIKHWKLLLLAAFLLLISSIFVFPEFNLLSKNSHLPKETPKASGNYKIEFTELKAEKLLNDGKNEGGDDIRLKIFVGEDLNRQKLIYDEANKETIVLGRNPVKFKQWDIPKDLKEAQVFASIFVIDKKAKKNEDPNVSVTKQPIPVNLKGEGGILKFDGEPTHRNNEVNYLLTYTISQKGE